MKAAAAALAGVLGLTNLTSAHGAQVRFELHGERGTAGVLSGIFYGLADQGVSTPTAVDLTLDPYIGSTSSTRHFGAEQFTSVGGLDVEGDQVSSPKGYHWRSLVSSDVLSLTSGLEGFTARFFDEAIFSYPADAPSEGGFLTFEVVSSAPEPTDWALMMAGVGAVGFVLRSRRRSCASL